jgi:hypothetical protein
MRKKFVLIVLVILALGPIATSLSALYEQNEYFVNTVARKDTIRVSRGFPVGWYGYTQTDVWGEPSHWYAPSIPPKVYWFSVESLLMDVAFWVVISLFVSVVAIKSVRALNLLVIARARLLGIKTSFMLLVMSLCFIALGVSLCLVAQRTSGIYEISDGSFIASGPIVIRPYLELGLRLIGSGTIALIATFSVIVWKPNNVSARSQKSV